MNDLYIKNIEKIKKHDPYLFRRIGEASTSNNIEVVIAKDGSPIPVVGSISLHSTYRPQEEAARLTVGYSPENGKTTAVFGLGFGYHIIELAEIDPGEILVIEPSLQIFVEFIKNRDITGLFTKVKFLVGEPVPKILSRFKPGSWNIFEHPPSIRINRNYFDLLYEGQKMLGYFGDHSLRVLVVGPIYGGSLTTARYCVQALKNLGHDISFVECDKFSDSFFALKNITRDQINSSALSQMFMNFMGEVVAARAAEFQPDLILSMAQAPLTPKAINKLKGLKAPVAFWFVEDFRTLTYWKEIAGSYDYFFTIQKNEFFDELEKVGSINRYYLPQACLPDLHKPVEISPEEKRQYSCDLSFMGAAYYNRVKSFPRLMDYDFKIWGTEWDLDSPLGKRIQNKNARISSEAAVKIYNCGKINLNLHSSTYLENVNHEGDFVNPRTLEIAACSGFQLVDERFHLFELFRVGEEMVTFQNMDELREKINYFLEHEDERRSLAAKARHRVLEEHTFEHRMTEMLLYIFQGKYKSLKKGLDNRKDSLEFFMEQAGKATPLGDYLEQYRGKKDFSFKKMVAGIENGEGALSDNELIMLMLDQVVRDKG